MISSTAPTAMGLLTALEDMAATLSILSDDYYADRPVDLRVMERPHQVAVALYGRWAAAHGFPIGSPSPSQILACHPGPLSSLEEVARWVVWATYTREADDLRESAHGDPIDPPPADLYPHKIYLHPDTWRVADGGSASEDWFVEPIRTLVYYEGASALDAAWLRDRVENRRVDWLAELPGLLLGILYVEARGQPEVGVA